MALAPYFSEHARQAVVQAFQGSTDSIVLFGGRYRCALGVALFADHLADTDLPSSEEVAQILLPRLPKKKWWQKTQEGQLARAANDFILDEAREPQLIVEYFS